MLMLAQPKHITQVYCYAVCLASVVALFVFSPPVLKAWQDLQHPLRADAENDRPSLYSLESYKSDVLIAACNCV